MVKSRAGRGILLTSNLPQLQNLIKVSSSMFPPLTSRADPGSQRDPTGYKEEFLTQYNHYLSLLRIYTLSPSSSAGTTATSDSKSDDLFCDLITFICQVAQCYPNRTKELPAQMKSLLLGSEGSNAVGSGVVSGEVRRTIVKNLVMLRNKDIIDSIE